MRRSRPCPRLSSPFLPWERLQSCCYLPRLLTTLTANAACNLLAVVPGGTGTIIAAAEIIKTLMGSALAAAGGVESALANARQMVSIILSLCMRLCVTPATLGMSIWGGSGTFDVCTSVW